MASELQFDPVDFDKGDGEPAFHVDVDGFEGPLDLLIELARRQKVDLHKISILALAEQYLAFVEAARQMRLELAADYLVMAAYLAYLKSRLLIPDPPRDDQPAAADLAADLAARMRRLAAIRRAAEDLVDRPRLGRDVFARGQPEALSGTASVVWEATLFDLLSAYGRQRQKHARSRVTLCKRVVWTLAQAREVLERMAGAALDWTAMEACLALYLATPETRRTVRASTFSAALELVREGRLRLRQDGAFQPLFLRAAPAATLARRAGKRPVMGEAVRLFEETASTAAMHEAMRIAEALLFATPVPLAAEVVARRLPHGVDVTEVLDRLRHAYAHRGVNLVRVAGGWALRTADDLAWLLSRDAVETKKLSRAAMETLAIIAYHQPVTRAEIEDIRGVGMSKGTLDTLMQTGWIRLRGRRKAPGRPLTYGTTPDFLSHFGLETIGDLPGLDDLKATGVLEGQLPRGFAVPAPNDDVALGPEEEPLGEDVEADLEVDEESRLADRPDAI